MTGATKKRKRVIQKVEKVERLSRDDALASGNKFTWGAGTVYGKPVWRTETERLIQCGNEIDRLARYILDRYTLEPGKDGKSESAVDVAIRLLDRGTGIHTLNDDELLAEVKERGYVAVSKGSKLFAKKGTKTGGVIKNIKKGKVVSSTMDLFKRAKQEGKTVAEFLAKSEGLK